MKISKAKLRQIIKEELSRVSEGERADRMWASNPRNPEFEGDESSLGDLQSDEQFTGGTPEERMLTLIKARELLAAMSDEELEELSLSLDGETVAELRHLLANPMFGSSGVKEGKVSSHRSEVTYSKEKRGKSKKPEKKAYNKADRAQAKRELKK